MSAQPIHHEPGDSHEIQMIMARLPRRERNLYLRLYREHALAAADDVAGYQSLQKFLARWCTRAAMLEQRLAETPSYYEDLAAEAEDVRSSAVQAVPAEEVFPGWAERVAAARARRQT